MADKTVPLRTTAVRAIRETAAKLLAVTRYEGVNTAEFLDGLIRDEVGRRFAALPEEFRRKVLEQADLSEG